MTALPSTAPGREWLLRPATTADSGAVRSLVFRVLEEYGLKPDPGGADADLFDLGAHYPQVGGWFGVLVDPTDHIVGSVGVHAVDGTTFEIRKMYLDRGCRGRGFGRGMLERGLTEAKVRGARRVVLETARVLREAVTLYERRGFRIVPGSPNVCRCDLVMELELGWVPA